MSNAILSFKSHNAGKNADVTIYEDRIEWVQKKGFGPLEWTATILTFGLYGLAYFLKGSAGSEMIPMKRVSSVTSTRKNPIFTDIRIYTGGNTIDFTVYNAEADKVKSTLNSLVLAV